MSKDDLKKELHVLIDNTDDFELLNMVKEEMLAYGTSERIDDLSYLTPEERKELEELAAEDPEKDAMSFEGLKQSMKEWRSK